ncbi:GntR family transcriptional regulator [Salinibacter altiplanensis]|uniref:GntR family transcriptional regulator n=1 Tax=Salinibacter altiplanensis TaxID=1803181 RepID=UPI000C9FDB8E|nr:GntR family transcriptional regulator [Salinibacter altiplanensis]
MELESGRPRHEQISDWLREQIEQGTYEVDEKLPSEKQLGEQFDVSRVTVRRALQTLESEDYIYRQQGLGSFVKERRAAQGLVRLTDFAQDMAQAGLDASSQVEHHAPETPPPAVAVHLDTNDQTVMRLDRLRLGDERPVAFDRTWLPLFYAQLLEDHDLEEETIYQILEAEYDIPILRGHYRITAANADAAIADRLGVDAGEALLLIERLSLSEGNKRVYFQRRYYRSDRVAYELELARGTTRHEAAEHGMPLREFEPVFENGGEPRDE